MGLKKAGIEQLKADLRANKRYYDQSTYGEKTECGTMMCLAGFCYLRTVGRKEFNKLLKDMRGVEFNGACVDAGRKQLGVESLEIFSDGSCWPEDLYERYYDAKNSKQRVEVACEALDRLKADGTFKEKKRVK